MAKILFNNTNYNIDDSSLVPTAADLQSHLSTVMNGSGASITFGGTVYSIDSEKLLAVKNRFISYLETVAGDGIKVTVGGVEYGVDSSKMSDAISELETTLNDLQTPAVTNDRLLSFDNYILKDKNELYLIPKEGN